jgi:orotate phosphoribosyltransferase
MFLGHFEPGKRVVIIEDVVTSGLSVMETVNELNKVMEKLINNNIKLLKVGLICKDAFCIVDREQGGAEYLEKEGIKLHRFTNSRILFKFSNIQFDSN